MDRWFSLGKGTLVRIALVGFALALTAGVAVAASTSGNSKASSVSPAVANGIAATGQQADNNGNGNGNGKVTVGHSAKNDKSPKLKDITPKPVNPVAPHPAQPNPPIGHDHKNRKDPVVQNSLAAPKMPAPNLNFDGIGYPGVNCFCAPPDTNGEVGATQYMQIVNTAIAVWDKTTGNQVLAPESIETLWSGFGGPCETQGHGDPVVVYDQLANRWLVSQFAGGSHPTDECVAVSQTSDATGSYNRYDFDLAS